MPLLKNKMLIVYLFGLALIGQTVLWEYARVQPGWRNDRFIITPWSIRGYETEQGLVLLGAAIVLAILGILVVRGTIKATRLGTAIVTAVVVAYAAVAAILADARETIIGGIGVMVMSALIATIVTVAVKPLTRRWLPRQTRALARIGVWVLTLIVSVSFVAGPLFGSDRRPTWLMVGILFGLIGLLMALREPAQVGPYRMLIASTAGVLVMAITMGTAVRFTLQRLQFALWEVSADRIELQITWGVILAWVGGLIAFIGAVGLWANRRDEIAARNRARRQQEAARQSEEELVSLAQ